MKNFPTYCIILIWSLSASAFAYEPRVTHFRVSEAAFDKSVLTEDHGVLQDLGLSKDVKFPSLTLPSGSIKEHLQDGSVREDYGKRALNHFFDPTRNAPITVLGFSLGKTSPDWALAARGSIAEQASSYYDAREYFYQALTAPDKQAREFLWGSTFATLGNVIHHLQDMAQPQHVRNDAHLAVPIVGNPSAYERYTTT